MFFQRLFGHGLGLSVGEMMRNAHSAWLTEALASKREYPRIPIRRVDEGGFSKLLARDNGEALAARWWDAALERVD
jgi:hypothetical protein